MTTIIYSKAAYIAKAYGQGALDAQSDSFNNPWDANSDMGKAYIEGFNSESEGDEA